MFRQKLREKAARIPLMALASGDRYQIREVAEFETSQVAGINDERARGRSKRVSGRE
jgi:hypothetical protein